MFKLLKFCAGSLLTLPFYALILAAIFVALPAYADNASFDCKQAALVDEKIICSDSLLSQADATLNQLYSSLMASLGDQPRQAALRADQHKWLLSRNRECEVARQTKVTEDNQTDYVDCFLAAYEERTSDLQEIKLHPEKAISDISTPIRRSQFSDNAGVSSERSLTVSPFRIGSAPLLAWSPTGSLAILAKPVKATSASLYTWKIGATSPSPLDTGSNMSDIQTVCLHDDEIILIRKMTSDAEPMMARTKFSKPSLLTWSVLTPETANTCHFDIHRQLVSSTEGRSYVDLGSRLDNDDRFVKLYKDNAAVAVSPPLRMDRRWPLHGDYLAKDDSFIISTRASAAPATEILRRWAKTGCMPFWKIETATGHAVRQCVPYGDYAKNLPTPLWTVSGLFFSIDDVGLYQETRDGTAVQVADGDIASAKVSLDQCMIAYAGPPRASGERAIEILNVCKTAN